MGLPAVKRYFSVCRSCNIIARIGIIGCIDGVHMVHSVISHEGKKYRNEVLRVMRIVLAIGAGLFCAFNAPLTSFRLIREECRRE